jgi:large subunit ribosomal protein L23
MNLTQILKRPIITEKSTTDASKGVFTFEVDVRSSKYQIQSAIESFYNVEVVQVRTLKSKPKKYKTGKKRKVLLGTESKKARIQLKPGHKIDLFELDGAK